MSTQIVVIDPKQFGLEEIKAANIAAQFQPMLDKMVELEKEYNEVINMEIDVPITSIKAKELRLKYVKVRTGTATIHKEQKEFYLAGGRFIDGWKNAQIFASQGIEDKLEAIEKHAENLEKKRIADLQVERENQLSPYELENLSSLNLGKMLEPIWQNFLTGTIANYNAKIEAAKKAELDRLETLRIDKEQREQQRLENERLKIEADKRDAEIKRLEKKRNAERLAADKIINEQRQEAIKKANDFAIVAAELQKEKDRVIKADKERLALKAAELQKAIDDARKLEEEKQAFLEAELSKGDGTKMQDLFNDLLALKTKYQFKSKKHQTLYNAVIDLIDKTVTYGKSKL